MNIRLKKIGNYRRVALFVGVFVALVVSAGLANHALAQGSESAQDAEGRIISIYDRGTERVIVTKAHTLRQALESAHVDVAIGHDVVEPGLDTELVAAKYNVNIYRARPVTVVDGPLRQKVTTAEQTSEGIAKAAGITLYKEDNVTIDAAHDLLRDGAGVVMAIDRATPVTLTLYGAKTEVRTQMGTVGELLQEKGIVVGKEDTLSVPTSTPIVAGMSIELWRDGKQTVTVDEEVDFSVEKIQDANREVGYREVQTTGVKGKRSVTYEIEMKNGQEVGRTEIASVVVEEPKTQVEVVGAKTSGNPLTKSMGVNQFTDSKGVVHRETYYDLPMSIVMGNYCGAGGYYTVRADGAKVDKDGYIIVAAHLGNYPRCSVVETSMGLGKVYDTGGFASVHPHGFDLATDWSNNNGI